MIRTCSRRRRLRLVLVDLDDPAFDLLGITSLLVSFTDTLIFFFLLGSSGTSGVPSISDP